MEKSAGHVFISYAREDADEVDQLQRMLAAAGIPVWRDTTDLRPGEDWRGKIRGAITRDALVFIACFSSRSAVREKSHQNEELLLAIEQLRQRRPDDPWLIPVRFDDCDLPDLEISPGREFASIQRADLFGPDQETAAGRLTDAVLRLLRSQAEITPARPLARQAGAAAGAAHAVAWPGGAGKPAPGQPTSAGSVRITIEVVALAVCDGTLKVLLIRRDDQPELVFPGGYVRSGEDASPAVADRLADETRLDGRSMHLELLAASSSPDLGNAVTITYLALTPFLPIMAGGKHHGPAWINVDHAHRDLASHHDQILRAAVEHVRTIMEFKPVATAFCAHPFTMDDLRNVYQAAWGITIRPRNFGQMALRRKGFIEPAGTDRPRGNGRAAKLYRSGSAQRLDPPMSRTQLSATAARQACN